jgi:hypothetical protein
MIKRRATPDLVLLWVVAIVTVNALSCRERELSGTPSPLTKG